MAVRVRRNNTRSRAYSRGQRSRFEISKLWHYLEAMYYAILVLPFLETVAICVGLSLAVDEILVSSGATANREHSIANFVLSPSVFYGLILWFMHNAGSAIERAEQRREEASEALKNLYKALDQLLESSLPAHRVELAREWHDFSSELLDKRSSWLGLKYFSPIHAYQHGSFLVQREKRVMMFGAALSREYRVATSKEFSDRDFVNQEGITLVNASADAVYRACFMGLGKVVLVLSLFGGVVLCGSSSLFQVLDVFDEFVEADRQAYVTVTAVSSLLLSMLMVWRIRVSYAVNYHSEELRLTLKSMDLRHIVVSLDAPQNV